MLYSVYDYDKKNFRYYDGLGAPPATGFFRKARVAPVQGAFVPEAFAVPLPQNARLVGEGSLPKGFIAEVPNTTEPGLASTSAMSTAQDGSGASSGSASGVSLGTAVALAVVAFLLGLSRGSRRAS